MCEQNKLGLVDTDLLRCLSCDLIPKLLIEKYLVEICRSQNVPFEPDQTIMAQDEFWTIGQRYVQYPNTNDEKRPPPPPSTGGAPSSGGSGGGGGAGAAHSDFSKMHPTQPSAPEVNFIFIKVDKE
jgi:vacuolar protein sorting-associated protein IST1